MTEHEALEPLSQSTEHVSSADVSQTTRAASSCALAIDTDAPLLNADGIPGGGGRVSFSLSEGGLFHPPGRVSLSLSEGGLFTGGWREGGLFPGAIAEEDRPRCLRANPDLPENMTMHAKLVLAGRDMASMRAIETSMPPSSLWMPELAGDGSALDGPKTST
jgi:hypothetical protein